MSGVLTDNEIIKALECLKGEKSLCNSCPYGARYPDCKKYAIRDVSDLIYRQKAKNEALKMDNNQLESDNFNANMNCEHLQAEIERLEKVQVQYVKVYFDEFAERLKNDFRLAQLDIGLTSAVVDELVDTMNNEFGTIEDFTALIESKAVKHFADRLKENKIDIDVSFGYGREVYTEAVAVIEIDNLVKEWEGEG